jgi:hypothetical protein
MLFAVSSNLFAGGVGFGVFLGVFLPARRALVLVSLSLSPLLALPVQPMSDLERVVKRRDVTQADSLKILPWLIMDSPRVWWRAVRLPDRPMTSRGREKLFAPPEGKYFSDDEPILFSSRASLWESNFATLFRRGVVSKQLPERRRTSLVGRVDRALAYYGKLASLWFQLSEAKWRRDLMIQPERHISEKSAFWNVN